MIMPGVFAGLICLVVLDGVSSRVSDSFSAWIFLSSSFCLHAIVSENGAWDLFSALTSAPYSPDRDEEAESSDVVSVGGSVFGCLVVIGTRAVGSDKNLR